MGSKAPYGYRIIKLPGEKGNTLGIEPAEADIVRKIYDMYGLKNMGCDIVQTSIYDAMRDWLEKYILQLNVNSEPATDPTETALQTVRGQLNSLLAQQTNICEYLEKGIYTVEMFEKRNTVLSKQIKQLQSAEADLLYQQSEEGKKKRATSDIIPTTQHILDNYAMLSTAEKESALENGHEEGRSLSLSGGQTDSQYLPESAEVKRLCTPAGQHSCGQGEPHFHRKA